MKTYVATIALILTTFICPVAPAAEQQEYYPSEVEAKYPAAFRSWQRIVPDNLRRFTWLSLFHGLGGPRETIYKDKRRGFLGWVCKQHDCGNNQASFLIAEDGSEAYGLVRSAEASGGMDLFLGDPDEGVKELLVKEIEDRS
jgi:hypothetical protein